MCKQFLAYPFLVCRQPDATSQQICQQLDLKLAELPPATGFYLLFDEQGLSLVNASQPKTQPLRVDFHKGSLGHRLRQGGARGQALAKACGLKQGITPSVFDATLGLATDASVLASLGCKVMGSERHPWAWALVADGLRRAEQIPELAWLQTNLQLVQADSSQQMAKIWHQVNSNQPQVIYLDPMFPTRTKSAQVKKNMQFFQQLIGQDLDADLLLEQALNLASHRVVVKRPSAAPFLANHKPSFSLEGKSNRFDVYALQSLS